MNKLHALVATALTAVAFGVSAQTAPAAPTDSTADVFIGGAGSSTAVLASGSRAAVQAEYLRARHDGEISAFDNRDEPFPLADLRQPAGAQRQDAHPH